MQSKYNHNKHLIKLGASHVLMEFCKWSLLAETINRCQNVLVTSLLLETFCHKNCKISFKYAFNHIHTDILYIAN